MKSTLIKITTSLLPLLMLLSTLSLFAERHDCSDFLVHTSFTVQTTNCGITMSQKTAMKKYCFDYFNIYQ